MTDNSNSVNVLQENIRKVVITPEDCSGAADFWTHFNIAMPAELKTAFESFQANPSVTAQDELKLQICKAIGYTDHEAFRDEMFKEIVEECRDEVYDMSFDKELTQALTPSDKE
jgi:hypothetical protein